ncbi:MAG: aldehyde dehydrogenase family protein, partial [Bdellovibrionaceae bacterium]|nr:aldehyde dehydrogenase family protein [Pseudobdellovibrionaceae bacterium]
ILAIMPWNFPMWQLFRMLPWNLLIGNSVLHKNSVYTPSITKAVTQIVQKFFPNQFYSFYLPDEEVEELIAHPLIHGVTLTGSTRAGRRVAAQAGAHLKKCVLELGGSDAFLVAPQAEVTKVVTQGIASRLINWGQSCIAAKRFIVHQRIFNDFVESLKKNLSTIASRNFVSVEAEERLRKQLHRALAEGAKVLWPVGEERWPAILISRGVEPFFFEEEFFGPVFILVSYDTLDEAITIANRNQFGLGASAWGYSLEEQNELQKRLEVSLLFFDDVVRSRPDVPFAGTKNSGWGWEMGILGFLEFTHLRIIKKSS